MESFGTEAGQMSGVASSNMALASTDQKKNESKAPERYFLFANTPYRKTEKYRTPTTFATCVHKKKKPTAYA